MGKWGRGPGNSCPSRKAIPQDGLQAAQKGGRREGPLSLPLGKYSGHSFRKFKDSVFPLLLTIPTLREITPFIKRKRKIIFQLKMQKASPAHTQSFCRVLTGPIWEEGFFAILTDYASLKEIGTIKWKLLATQKRKQGFLLLPTHSPPLTFF